MSRACACIQNRFTSFFSRWFFSMIWRRTVFSYGVWRSSQLFPRCCKDSSAEPVELGSWPHTWFPKYCYTFFTSISRFSTLISSLQKSSIYYFDVIHSGRISGIRPGVNEDLRSSGMLRSIYWYLPTFRENLSVPSLRVEQSKCLTLEDGTQSLSPKRR